MDTNPECWGFLLIYLIFYQRIVRYRRFSSQADLYDYDFQYKCGTFSPSNSNGRHNSEIVYFKRYDQKQVAKYRHPIQKVIYNLKRIVGIAEIWPRYHIIAAHCLNQTMLSNKQNLNSGRKPDLSAVPSYTWVYAEMVSPIVLEDPIIELRSE